MEQREKTLKEVKRQEEETEYLTLLVESKGPALAKTKELLAELTGKIADLEQRRH